MADGLEVERQQITVIESQELNHGTTRFFEG